ncbi:LuxR C-terminal-related transcriptional regulator [Chloroflexota bacterium]
MIGKESKSVRLYVVEDQEIFGEVYKSIFPPGGPIHLLDIFTTGELRAMKDALSALNPDVLLVSTKKLERNIIEGLQEIRSEFPRIGIVLLLMLYNAENVQLVRNLAARAEAGMAVFLKQSVDRVDQLYGIIMSVSEGQVILDPALTSLMFAEKQGHPFLSQLTARELEILSLLAGGCTNSAIAVELYIDIRTVQHHINNMYSKFKADLSFNNMHPRVSAARLYLENTGELLITGVRV